MQIVILSGGKATRLYPLTKKIPKSLIEICGKPFLTHQIELLKKNKITDILLCVGKFSDQIINYYGDGKEFDVSIKYSIENPNNLLGTGGALKKAEKLLDKEFLVMYGDSYLPIDFTSVISAFHQSKKTGLMTVFKNQDKFDKSNVDVQNGLVLRYEKSGKNNELQYIDYGLLVLKKELLTTIPDDKFVDLVSIIKSLVEKNELVSFTVTERFYEIGSTSGKKNFEEFIKSN